MNILHLTDLHFGRGPTEAANDERELALNGLISVVSGLDETWRPNVVCVSGDIGFAGKAEDYRLASDWLKKLLNSLNLTADRVLFCAGNHDIQRAVSITYARPNDPKEADGCLGTPIAEQYARAFSEFSKFCQDLGTPPYELGADKSFLTGVRCIDSVRFVSMNSAWFCRDNNDTQKLWIGLPMLRHLQAAGQWPLEAEPCVALLHHPREDFNPNEITAYSSRPNTYDHICGRSDILLSGHKHGEIRPPDRIADRALVFSGGATYAGEDYNNSFQILRLLPGKVQFRAFAFDPRTRSWQSAGDASERPIGTQAETPSSVRISGIQFNRWKELSISDLRRIRNAKSRAATPSGKLPVLIERQVAIQRIETHSLGLEKNQKTKSTTPLWPLFEAIRRTPGRKALLLGDLGTGKSTLLCDFIERTTLPITKNERRAIIRNEREAQGTADDLNELIEAIESDIDQHPAVAELLSSPLTIRLFSPRLGVGSLSTGITLGDLLLDVFEERLGKWAERDSKQSTTPNLDLVLPTPRSRAQLLGEALIDIPRESELTRDGLETRLQNVEPLKNHPQKVALANEAISVFMVGGILQGGIHLTFSLQAFRETALAYGLIFSTQNPSLAGVEPARWREVSFTAALCRRLGDFVAHRSEFAAYLNQKLNDLSSVAAGASVVVESQDRDLAITFISILRQLGSHPLNVADLDRDGSARAIATAMRLAGDDGFNWFYDEYLDPRYPVRFAGSAVLDWVFSEWLYQVEPKLSPEQKNRLAKLVRPHISANTYQVHNLIARISFVAPQECSLEERLYFATTMLSDPRYRKRALAVIQEAYQGGNRQVVENLLGGKIRQGFEDSGLVAAVLLQNNSGKAPIAIIRSLLHSMARLRSNPVIEESLTDVKDELGTEVWIRVLLWLLFDSDASAAASAAILLHEESPVSAEMIRTPLLRALHDGAYVRKAEEILTAIVRGGPIEHIYWLADSIRQSDPHHGGYSGWWRLFLDNIERLGPDGPRVLASAVCGLSCFVLPRNPEIRQRFRELLLGTHGSEYRNELRTQFDSYDPEVRRAAAAILVTADPKSEAKALYIAVQALDANRSFDWHEWYDMCYALAFGPGPLTTLESKLNSLGTKARQFALRLLFQNGIHLDAERQAELIGSLLERYSFTEAEIAFLDSHTNGLIALLESDHGQKAAGQLLRIGALDITTEAKCWVLVSEHNLFRPRFESVLQRALEDSDFNKAVKAEGEASAARGQKPLLPLLIKAIQTGDSWKDVLWHFFIRGERHSKSESEIYGLWAINYGKANPVTAKHIGAAAKALLEDPMLTQQHRGEPVQWIALLADEFSSIPQATLELTLATGSTIEKQAACAIIARLGFAPQSFIFRNYGFQILSNHIKWTIREYDNLLEELRNFSRDADTVPEGTCDAIQEILYSSRTPSDGDLNLLTLEGANGALISVVLRYCFRSQVNFEILIGAMGRHLNIFEQNSHCMRRLVEIWRAVRTDVSIDGGETKSHFIKELQRFISERRKLVEAATELLLLGELPPENSLSEIFDDLISNHTYRDDAFLWNLSHLPITKLSASYKTALSTALLRSVSLLNLRTWNSTELGNGTPATFLTIALCHAALVGHFTAESTEVFYRGVKFLAVREPRNDGRDLSELFLQIEPLLAVVPTDAISALFHSGLSHQDAVIRTVSRFALAAAGNQKAVAGKLA